MNHCQDCGHPLSGRTDKKFCGDHCRSHYHNQLNRNRLESYKKVNRILRKNAGVLEAMISSGHRQASRQSLAAAGFNFRFFTHEDYERSGRLVRYCYQFGYLQLDIQEYLLLQVPAD